MDGACVANEPLEENAMIATTSELLRKYDVPGPRYTSYPSDP